MNSNFNCSYMAMSSLTYILGFSVKFFQPVYSVQEYYEIKITSKSFAQKFELKLSLGGPLSKLCVTLPFSINFRYQIENQVSDYRVLGASSQLTWTPSLSDTENITSSVSLHSDTNLYHTSKQSFLPFTARLQIFVI